MSVFSGIAESAAQPLRAGAETDATVASVCLHCAQPLGRTAEDGFCCNGCRAVYRALRKEGLDRYYALRRGAGVPVPELSPETRDDKWLEPLEHELAESDGTCTLGLDVQGIHCAACVWVIEELFRREPHAIRALVNPAVGRVELAVERGFDLRRYVRAVERLGYLFGPALKVDDDSKSDDLLLRTGICIALAGNTMLFAAAIYLGLDEGPVFRLMHQLQYALGVASVLVGGSVFVKSALAGLRARVLHLDTPIALGIVLAFAGSTWSFFFGAGRASYFDSLSIFIALMLLGRLLQERVLEKNRRQLLASDGAEGLLARRVRDGAVALVPCRELAEGDELLIAPGDLVPVYGALLDADASCSLDWINGESAPRTFARGATIPAGAFNLGTRAIRVRTETAFDRSPLVELLRSPRHREHERFGRTPWWQRYARVYVGLVLSVAAVGLSAWLFATGDAMRATEVAIAILVVTCPCAFGIATPLAHELVQAGLRRAGLLVRSATFLDRAREVRRVVFDKTGTLTTGRLAVTDAHPLETLTSEDRQALYDLVARSAHPKSLAVKRALDDRFDMRLTPGVEVTERPGEGLFAAIAGRAYAVRAPDVTLVVDGEARAHIQTTERLRPDAAADVARLATEGFDVHVLSGDAPDKVRAMADTLGLSHDRAHGGYGPAEKAAWIDAHDRHDTLMIGDGINDGLAVDRAFASGTPAVDRPFMPARSDFYLVTAGLAPVTLALRASHALARTVRTNLSFATAYNVIAVALALAGLMQPWLAAVLMPASSLVVLAKTTVALSGRSPLWKS